MSPAMRNHRLVEPGRKALKALLIVSALAVLPVALAGCVTDRKQPLPMELGHDAGRATCLRYSGAPAYDNCKGHQTVSIPQS